ncbi:MAG TPA: hypothetical protein VN914_16545, partial [Polyangia bacterium]|nr:hypothetical protein [Polyangia bacterium]
RPLLPAVALAVAGACGAPPSSLSGGVPDAGSPTAPTPGTAGNNGGSAPKDPTPSEPEAPLGHVRTAPGECGLDIGDIALYQGVKTLLVRDGAEVRKHAVDVVQRRPGLLRVFVKAGSGFAPGQVQASLTLSGRDGKKVLVAERKITGSSTDADLESTLNFDVPAGAIDDKTSFAVELTAPAACAQVRFPEEKAAPMGARQVGKLRIKLVPIRYVADGSNRLPDTSEAQLALLRARLQAMYPVESVELTVREPVKTTMTVSGAPQSWDALLDSMRDLRAADNPDSDIYYFGLISPAENLAAYCPDQCYMGLSFRTDRAASKYQAGVGLGFSGEIAGTVLAHELGHMAGRKHAPCKVSTYLDPMYPSPEGKTGSWGWDMRSHALLAPDTTDLMGYCNPTWISDYTYRGILDRMIEVDSSGKSATTQSLSSEVRVLMVGGGQARWGLDASDGGEGAAEAATIRDEAGAVVATVEVRRLDVGEGDRSVVLVPQPQPGWATIEVAGAAPVRFDEVSAGSALER